MPFYDLCKRLRDRFRDSPPASEVLKLAYTQMQASGIILHTRKLKVNRFFLRIDVVSRGQTVFTVYAIMQG